MGIGSAVKNMLSGDENTSNPNATTNSSDLVHETTPTSKLPTGTGPGTTGKAAPENTTAPAGGINHTSGQVDPPADYSAQANPATKTNHTHSPFAVGAGLAASTATKKRGSGLFGVRSSKEVPKDTKLADAETHTAADGFPTNLDRSNQMPRSEKAMSNGGVVQGPQKTSEGYDSEGAHRRGLFGSGTGALSADAGRKHHHLGLHSGSAVQEPHGTGRIFNLPHDAKGVEERMHELLPVTHEVVRVIETEEVSRVQEHERHIHHIQHHMQPIIASEELVEEHTTHRYPPTEVHEVIASNTEDTALLDGLLRQHHDTLKHAEKERIIVDKGTVVNEHIHHHIHHIIQPVIEKETIDKRRIHATIPIHTVTHEAPVVHQSQVHDPVPFAAFVKAHAAVPQTEIPKKVLHQGKSTRRVEGIAEDLERDLHLGKNTTTGVQPVREDAVGKGQLKVSQQPVNGGVMKPAAEAPTTPSFGTARN